MFRGTFTALVTPFRNDAVDFEALAKLIESQIAAGITGIVAVGTTGEAPTLSHDERHAVIQKCVEVAGGRCQVLAGTGSYSTRDAIQASQQAQTLGVDGLLIVAPYYNKPSQEGLFQHFRAIAQSTSLPIMLYNIPGRCGVDIGVETVVRLAGACRNIVSIKEASGSVDRVSELRGRFGDSLTVLSGDDSLTLPFMAVGAVGVVSVASNLLPAEVVSLVNAHQRGDVKLAENLHRLLFPLFKDLFIEPNPVPVKTALAWAGTFSGDVRLPLCPMTEANQERLRRTLDAFRQNRENSRPHQKVA
ncbi:MAG TPA: 4-hydroxy-tetrahydrodipicolinate synthase [Chthoniobacterales bacterium]|nr:4-hydroxy-tetrahydrodipicolinate synthase [Chthoniobacterales bacterium]